MVLTKKEQVEKAFTIILNSYLNDRIDVKAKLVKNIVLHLIREVEVRTDKEVAHILHNFANEVVKNWYDKRKGFEYVSVEKLVEDCIKKVKEVKE